ncbi:hypothetical protein [Pedobacter punctiformis]|uniref:Uncharacterized protein n=1 Tax=Pedobacter punctiformis TaxID=3004097 RepID=A0ABT4LAN4_9SPHI|nr:hypothetical protein [Pedobacter sp. HCMS5-2]MCZ4244980.1 hypothetical protein [Pedobacter sp. HCMS5-2]
MKWVKFKSDLFVASTGKLHKKGQVLQVSDSFAQKHGSDGSGLVEETKKPKETVIPISNK